MPKDKGSVLFAVLGYATCSSLMLVVNKVCVHMLPAPSFVLLMQVSSAWISVKACGLMGMVEVDELELPKLKSFFWVSVAFLACIFANIKTLQYCNVETFIVFRASTPVVIGVADWLFLGRELPNTRSSLSMLALVVGAGAYMYTDASYVVHGYRWVAIWFCTFCFDQLYIKHVVDSVAVRSNWGRVFYTNLWSSILLLFLTVALEPHVLTKTEWTQEKVAALALSCALGTAMSYFAFLCRAAVSATSFTVVGNVCKVTSVLINIVIWDKHASPLGIGFLLACLVAAGAYQAAPLRTVEVSSTHLMSDKDNGDTEEGEVPPSPPAGK
jgi:GDP-mannose transporter